MTRQVALALVLVLALPTVVPSAASSKHSGVILTIAPGAATITMEEIGIGIQSGNQVIRWVVELTPRTTIEMVAREAAAPAQWPGGYRGSPVGATALRAGDFATVEGEPRQDRLVASAITVIRPAPE
jgi:hypothetical protein